MKRKLLLRVLSCLLAGTLMLESPAQAFAAQMNTGAEVPVTEDQEISGFSLDNEDMSEDSTEPETPAESEEPTEPETPAESEEPTEPETPAESEEPTEPETPAEGEEPTEPETPAESEEPTEPETPAEGEEPAEPETPAEGQEPTEPETPAEGEEPTEPETPAEGEEPTEPETPLESEEPTEPETPADDMTPGDIQNMLQIEEETEEPITALATTKKVMTMKASRYGTKPEVLISSSEAKSYSAILNKLKEAMAGDDAPMADLSNNGNITVTLLENLVNYLLENNPNAFKNLLPQADYGVDTTTGYVKWVQFEFAEESMTLKAEGRTATSAALRLSGLVSNATSYKLMRRSEAETDVKAVSAAQSGTLFTDNTAGVHDYTYIVYAYDSNNQVCAYTNLVTSNYVLAAPSGLTVTLRNPKSAGLKWTAPQGAQNYKVYRDGTVKATMSSKTTTWTDNDIASGVNHTYKVVALTKIGNRTCQSETTVELKWDKGLTKPSVKVSSDAGDRVTLSWNTVSGAKGYLIYQISGDKYQKVKDTTAVSQMFTGLDAGRTYQYVVLPYRMNGQQMVYGNVSGVVSARPKLAKVTLKAETEAYNKIKLTWNERSGASGYNIYRKNSSGKYVLLKKITTGSTTSYTDSKLTLNKTYSYKIVPFRTADGTDYEGNESEVASAKTVLDKAEISSVKGTNYKTIKVTWKKVDGANGYEIYRSTSSKSGFKRVKRITSGSKVSYSNSGLTLGKNYYYKVRAYRTVNGKKVYGDWSKVVKGQTALNQVKSLKVKAEDYNTLKLTWKKVSQADKYQIYYKTSKDGKFKRLTTVSDTEYSYGKAVCGQTYYFKVRAIKKVNGKTGYGTYSSVVSKKTTIGKPTIKISETAYNRITLEWKEVTGAQKYEVYGSTSQNGTYKSLGTTKNTTFTHKNLTLGKTYYYKVRAIRQKFTSNFSGVKSGKTTLGKLTGLKVKKYYDGTLKISWDEVEGATSYQVYRSTVEDDDEEYKRIASVTTNSYIDSGVSSRKTYYYKVCGVRGEFKTNLAGPVSEKSSAEDTEIKGIDVSSGQGKIDWKKVADDGIEFAIIRCVIGDSSSTERDSKFEDNYDGARDNGIKVGVYRYSYATSRTKAREEAQNVIDALNGRKLDYPIFMDMENDGVLAKTGSNERRTEIILAFKEVIEDAGYKFGLYAGLEWLNKYLDMDQLKDVDIWVARWRDYKKGHGYNGKGNVTMWQYTEKGRVNGINKNVDLDVSYKDY